jgi:hypothetical protein
MTSSKKRRPRPTTIGQIARVSSSSSRSCSRLRTSRGGLPGTVMLFPGCCLSFRSSSARSPSRFSPDPSRACQGSSTPRTCASVQEVGHGHLAALRGPELGELQIRTPADEDGVALCDPSVYALGQRDGGTRHHARPSPAPWRTHRPPPSAWPRRQHRRCGLGANQPK